MLDERRLRLMRAHAVIINTARGAIVDERALARILEENGIAGAGLDVYVEEPLSVIRRCGASTTWCWTSHLGWPADSTYRTMAEGMVAIVEGYLDGRHDRAINPEALKNRR